MNKKIFGIALTLVVLTILVTPTIAVSSNKVPVVFSTGTILTDETDAKTVTNLNGIFHVWGAVRTGPAYLQIGDGPQLTGTVNVDCDYIKFPDVTVIYRYRKMTITFEAQTGLDQEGTFVGTLTWKANLPDFLNTFESHAVLQGSGGFEGYTLHLDKNIGELPTHWMLIP